MKMYFAIVIQHGGQPTLSGPHPTEDDQDTAICALIRESEGQDAEYYWLDIDEPNGETAVMGAYSNGFVEDVRVTDAEVS